MFVWAKLKKFPLFHSLNLHSPALRKPAKTASMFCLQTGENEACVWDPHLNLFILIRDRKCYNLSPRTFANYDYRDNMRLQLVSNLIKLRDTEGGENRDLFTAFIYKVIGCFLDPGTAHRAIRTVLIEKKA